MYLETLLLIVYSTTIALSFVFSIAESSVYAVPLTFVKHLAESGSRSGRVLLLLKEKQFRALTSILFLNSLIAGAGLLLSGAIASKLWHGEMLFCALMALVVLELFLGEILPKSLGAAYSRTLAPLCAYLILLMTKLMRPFTLVSEWGTRALRKELPDNQLVEQGPGSPPVGESGGIEALAELEGKVIQNAISLDKILVREILTPRVVMFRLSESVTLAEIERDIADWSFSRVPITSVDDEDSLTGYVLQRDVYRELVKGNKNLTLKELARPLPVVPELMRLDRLLLRLIDRREHLCAVVDERGGLAGLVSLEDVVEELVGKEIVDEYDSVTDLRIFAGLLKAMRSRQLSAKEDQMLAKAMRENSAGEEKGRVNIKRRPAKETNKEES